MRVLLAVIVVICVSLACTVQTAPVRSKSDLSLLKIELLKSLAQSQAFIQQSNDQEMVKTYCKLISQVLEMIGTKIPSAEDYCNSIDDNASFPGLPGQDKSKENIYNKILDVLKYINIPITME